MTTRPGTVRFHHLEACFNFRDLGGYSTADGATLRWGTIYRSDALHRLTPRDVDFLRRLDLATVIDLRSPEEIEDFGRAPDEIVGSSWHHEPLIESLRLRVGEYQLPAGEEGEVAEPGERYFEFLGDGSRAASVVRHVAHAPGPAVFHCTAGKDRTGMIAAMLFELVGVPDETIVADYVLTDHTRDRARAWIEANEPQLAELQAQLSPERRRTSPEAIRGFLDRLRDTHGSAEELLRSRGVTDDDLAALRARLVDG